MDKRDFLVLLRDRISDLPQADIDERLNFYSEMIDDYMEEGLSEAEAVERIGSVNEIAAQILADASPSQPEEQPKKAFNPWRITAIILGSPVWLPLLISAFAIVISIYASLWAVIISLWSVFGALVCCAFAGILCGIGLAVTGNAIPGVAMVGAALVCGGLSIVAFYSCKLATKVLVQLTKKIAIGIKNRLRKRRLMNDEQS